MPQPIFRVLQFMITLPITCVWVKRASLMLAALSASMTGTEIVQAAEPKPWQLGLPEPVSPVAHHLLFFHNDILMPLITVITLFVLGLLIYVCIRFRERANPVPSKRTHNVWLEVIWTAVPVVILVALFVPSMRVLYATDAIGQADMTVKVTGYQWYWNYEYPDEQIGFDAYLLGDDELTDANRHLRLMATDNQLVLPVGQKIRFIITSGDVLHAWAVSDFGVRMDAVPGRLNETWALIEKPGEYFGFCSELCGQGHAYMPIHVRAVPMEEYQQWLDSVREEFSISHHEDPKSLDDEDGGDLDNRQVMIARNGVIQEPQQVTTVK
ncbi:MAG: cytochrome c oxidase subunit II [Pseudomonadota bacterium]